MERRNSGGTTFVKDSTPHSIDYLSFRSAETLFVILLSVWSWNTCFNVTDDDKICNALVDHLSN